MEEISNWFCLDGKEYDRDLRDRVTACKLFIKQEWLATKTTPTLSMFAQSIPHVYIGQLWAHGPFRFIFWSPGCSSEMLWPQHNWARSWRGRYFHIRAGITMLVIHCNCNTLSDTLKMCSKRKKKLHARNKIHCWVTTPMTIWSFKSLTDNYPQCPLSSTEQICRELHTHADALPVSSSMVCRVYSVLLQSSCQDTYLQEPDNLSLLGMDAKITNVHFNF